jgi:hypothetical protein
MTRTKPSGFNSITKMAVAGVLIAIPMAGVSVPVNATPGVSGTSNTLAPNGVHPAQPPAAPSTDEPQPPAPAPAPYQSPADYDWWSYGTGDGGAGGGGGGG